MLQIAPRLTLQNLEKHMVPILGGTFHLGDKVEVTLSPYQLCRYPATQALWQAVMGENPSLFKGAQRPVEQVTWYDAVSFCNVLSEQQGLDPCYEINGEEVSWQPEAKGYRLPTEAEWEYAARGGPCRRGPEGNGFAYAGSPDLDQVGWHTANSGRETQPVGEKRPNELGLYDMSGNVREWCWDWYGDYPSEAQVDPTGPEGGSFRVDRGGSWYDDADICRVALRLYVIPDSRLVNVGFRLARHV